MLRQFFIAGVTLSFILYIACQPITTEQDNTLNGEKLAQIHCASCHQLPTPELLPKSTWEQHVLPRMGYMLGIYPNEQIRKELIEKGPGGAIVEAAKIFPSSAVLNETQWSKIKDYYLSNAPDHLLVNLSQSDTTLPFFKAQFPNYQLSPPSTTLLQFHESGLYLGDAHSQAFYDFDNELNMQRVAKAKEGVVAAYENQDALHLTVMGSFSPTDAPSGFILKLSEAGQPISSVLIDQLQRPVHSSFADLNQDNREDIIISEFAKWTGGLSWWEQTPDGKYLEHNLRQKAGAIKTAIDDVDGDGLVDIIALFGQGDEGFYLYHNEGNGKFKEEKIIPLASSMGSSSFRLVDYNKDNKMDILYTAGDNADYPPILKPYHGIYLYENKGDNHYQEVFFHSMPGAYGAIAEDFDQDGEIDIAAISFFPDFQKTPNGGFVFLHNQGAFEMKAYSFPQSQLGRWIVMDSGDLDKDGDIDLALGSLAFEVIPDNGEVTRWVKNGLPFIILENQLY